MTSLTCYQIHETAPRIVPACAERGWMEATTHRFAYRCLPLSIANAMGWELLLPARVTAGWNGGRELSDMTVEVEGAAEAANKVAGSHFGHGVLTFHVGYLFRTDPGYGLWARGAPNLPKDGIAPLEGIIETDWLNFTFTMNWSFTRPGRVTFEKDEPFCFITPVAYRALDAVVPEIRPIESDAEIDAEYRAYSKARLEFNSRLAEGEPETVRQGWQKWYMRGEDVSGAKRNEKHLSKLKLATPVTACAGADAAGSDESTQ